MRYISVKAYPGSRKNEVVQKRDEKFEVYTKEPREENRANEHILELLADFLHVSITDITLVRGHHQQNKICIIKNGSKN